MNQWSSQQTSNYDRDKLYIQKAKLNSKSLNRYWFYHKDFARGGILELWLGSRPNKLWGKGKQAEGELANEF
jgi:putative alpha-1,2-mannosidase